MCVCISPETHENTSPGKVQMHHIFTVKGTDVIIRDFFKTEHHYAQEALQSGHISINMSSDVNRQCSLSPNEAPTTCCQEPPV